MERTPFASPLRGSPSWDPFHEFFAWLTKNNTDWCITASNYYQIMLYDTNYCPGDGPISESFCSDFTQAYVTKCVKNDATATDDKSMVAVFAVALSCALFSGYVASMKCNVLPESAVCILVGLGAGSLLYSTATKENHNIEAIGFDASIFFLVLVPPIALQSLLEVNPKHFCRNFPSIMWLAICNTILTCLTVGFIVFYCSDLSMPTCLLMGAISSSVDPTALRVALDERLQVLNSTTTTKNDQDQDHNQDPNSRRNKASTTRLTTRLNDLDATIFGESTLNDGVSFVLYTALLPLVIGTSDVVPTPSESPMLTIDIASSRSLTPSSTQKLEQTAAECIANFTTIYTASFFVGVMSGLIAAVIFKLFSNSCALRAIDSSSEKSAGRRGMVVFIALLLLPYFLCELVDLSGLVGLSGSTFIMLSFTKFSLTKGQRKGVLEITRTWSKLSEFFIFSYVGFCIAAPLAPSVVGVTDVKFDFDWKLITVTCGASLLARGWIIVLGWLSNLLRKKSVRYEFRSLVVMWWSGLRGPVCFALALSVPHYNFVTHVVRYIFQNCGCTCLI